MGYPASAASTAMANQRPFVPGLWHGRPMTPEQSDQTDEYSDEGFESDFDDEDTELYEPDDRTYRVGDRCWIRLRKTWYIGVVRQISTPDQSKDGRRRYHVYFRRKNASTNMRATAHPREGTMKPDTLYIRNLLAVCGARIGSSWEA